MYFEEELFSLTPEHRIDGVSDNKIKFGTLKRIHLQKKKKNQITLG